MTTKDGTHISLRPAQGASVAVGRTPRTPPRSSPASIASARERCKKGPACRTGRATHRPLRQYKGGSPSKYTSSSRVCSDSSACTSLFLFSMSVRTRLPCPRQCRVPPEKGSYARARYLDLLKEGRPQVGAARRSARTAKGRAAPTRSRVVTSASHPRRTVCQQVIGEQIRDSGSRYSM